jgi:hypothetical protein
MRESLIFYRSFYEAIKTLPPENQAKIYDAIFSYSLDFQEPELEGIDNAIFTLIKPQLDANIRKYENGKKGAEHGKKGGRPKKKKENTDNLNTKKTPKKPLENPKLTPNVNDNVNDNVNKKENEKENTQKECDLDFNDLEIPTTTNPLPEQLQKSFDLILDMYSWKETRYLTNYSKVRAFLLELKKLKWKDIEIYEQLKAYRIIQANTELRYRDNKADFLDIEKTKLLKNDYVENLKELAKTDKSILQSVKKKEDIYIWQDYGMPGTRKGTKASYLDSMKMSDNKSVLISINNVKV